MKTRLGALSTIILCSGLAVALAFASGCGNSNNSSGGMAPMSGSEHKNMQGK